MSSSSSSSISIITLRYAQQSYLSYKVRVYKEYHSLCPLVGIGTLPTPLSPASVPLPPEPGGGGGGWHTRLRVIGWGSPNADH